MYFTTVQTTKWTALGQEPSGKKRGCREEIALYPLGMRNIAEETFGNGWSKGYANSNTKKDEF
jgi:hypothetical protein